MTNAHERILRKSLNILLLAFLIGALGCTAPPDPRRTGFRVERGNVAAQYDNKTGRLRRLEVDTNKNGKVDVWQYMDGTRIDRVEIDRDEDGQVDRWEYYVDNKLEKVGTSTRGDGIVDEWAFQGATGILARVETDTDRDGRIDKWETFDPPRAPGGTPVLRSVAFDPDASGNPTRRLRYADDGTLEGVERLNLKRAQ